MGDNDPRLDPFDYRLPPEAIARTPPERRDGGRLLYTHGGRWTEGQVPDLVDVFSPGDVLVVNDTRVLSARMFGHRKSGGRVELLLLEPGPGPVSAMVRPGRKIGEGESISLLSRAGAPTSLTACVGGPTVGGARTVSLSADPLEVMALCGHVPLPPYMNREATESDEIRYQTVFADEPGAVAAPTASLHLTEDLLTTLQARGVEVHRVTLHVGAGTFRNLRSEDLDRGALHRESYRIPEETAAAIAAAKQRGSAVTAVGTTVTRTLESAASADGHVRHGAGETTLFIRPGFEFQVVDRLMTNFHLPRSSLLMLVCAFGGHDHVMAGYAKAVEGGLRFYSYGDAMLLDRGVK
jgi:S-adenosylmethionine:tRNA ribosyltransferase-isomerase